MAKKKDQEQDLSKVPVIKKAMNFIQKSIDRAYGNTHFVEPTNSKELDSIKTNMNKSIDNMIGNNVEKTGISNISILYNRTIGDDEKKIEEDMDLNNVFNESAVGADIMSSVMSNRAIKEYDQEIDIVCKYMPSLEDALDAKKDNVLSADHFTKDFINCIPTAASIDEDVFENNIKRIKEQYNLIEKLENVYDHTAKYGETFVYVVPYKKALQQLLSNRMGGMAVSESTEIISESVEYKEKDKSTTSQEFKVNLCIDESMILTETVQEYKKLNDFKMKVSKNKIIDDDLQFEGPSHTDGFVDVNDKKNKDKVDVSGCIFKELPRENVIPLYIEDSCLGYYYIECDNDIFEDQGLMNGKDAFNKNMALASLKNTDRLSMEDQVLKNISRKITDKLDAKFINANPELKNEIYKILKFNNINAERANNIRISFLPPSDVIHSYFKQDPKTHRGISDLDKALLPAKIFSSIYLTNSLGILTRSQDKRVYYIKQSVDSNISGTLLNTISQIQKSNFGAREFTNIKNLLNITGRFNEFVIPVGPSGDSPINFEVMPGQQIDTQEDFMNRLEQMAVNSTDVPYEYVQSRTTVDYAVRLTMSSGKFLRKVFKRQAKTSSIFSRIVNIIYTSEYGNDENPIRITVQLPPPAMLNILNTNQMFQNLEEYSTFIANMFYSDAENDDSDQAKRQIFMKNLKKHYAGTTIDLAEITRIKEMSEMQLKQMKTVPDEENM